MSVEESKLFEDIIYNLYDIFFDILDSTQLQILAKSSKDINTLIRQSGGVAKFIKFDWKTSFNEFINNMTAHKRIQKLEYCGSGLQMCIFDFLVKNPNMKIIILRDPYMTTFDRPDIKYISSSQLKRPSRRKSCISKIKPIQKKSIGNPMASNITNMIKNNAWTNIEYMFILDNNAREFTISLKHFPNIKFIGCYKSSVSFTNETDKLPFVMDFKDIHSIELLMHKKYNALKNIIDNLAKIYKS